MEARLRTAASVLGSLRAAPDASAASASRQALLSAAARPFAGAPYKLEASTVDGAGMSCRHEYEVPSATSDVHMRAYAARVREGAPELLAARLRVPVAAFAPQEAYAPSERFVADYQRAQRGESVAVYSALSWPLGARRHNVARDVYGASAAAEHDGREAGALPGDGVGLCHAVDGGAALCSDAADGAAAVVIGAAPGRATGGSHVSAADGPVDPFGRERRYTAEDAGSFRALYDAVGAEAARSHAEQGAQQGVGGIPRARGGAGALQLHGRAAAAAGSAQNAAVATDDGDDMALRSSLAAAAPQADAPASAGSWAAALAGGGGVAREAAAAHAIDALRLPGLPAPAPAPPPRAGFTPDTVALLASLGALRAGLQASEAHRRRANAVLNRDPWGLTHLRRGESLPPGRDSPYAQ